MLYKFMKQPHAVSRTSGPSPGLFTPFEAFSLVIPNIRSWLKNFPHAQYLQNQLKVFWSELYPHYKWVKQYNDGIMNWFLRWQVVKDIHEASGQKTKATFVCIFYLLTKFRLLLSNLLTNVLLCEVHCKRMIGILDEFISQNAPNCWAEGCFSL